MYSTQALINLVAQVEHIAEQAAAVIMPYFTPAVDVQAKSDGSPVTLADQAADTFICQALRQLTPEIPIVSEEMTVPLSNDARLQSDYLWLVDPLDGTRQFIRGDDGFSVNIALIYRHQPILGVVYAPVTAVGYAAIVGGGAWRWCGRERQVIHVSPVYRPIRVLVGFFSHQLNSKTQALLALLPNYRLVELGSSLKICRIAEGLADIYPRFGATSEWDTAAAQVILTEAGGALRAVHTDLPLVYNSRLDLENPAFYAVGQPDYPWPSMCHL